MSEKKNITDLNIKLAKYLTESEFKECYEISNKIRDDLVLLDETIELFNKIMYAYHKNSRELFLCVDNIDIKLIKKICERAEKK